MSKIIAVIGRYEVDDDGTVWDMTGVRNRNINVGRIVASFEEPDEALLWTRLVVEHGPKRRRKRITATTN